MKRKRKNALDSSDEESEVESESADSDDTVSNSRPAPKKKATARKRGRPPVNKKTAPQSPTDDSDGGSTRPNSPQNANGVQSEDEENSSDSDYVADSSKRAKKGRGKPSLTNNKKQKLQNGVSRDTSPQPSTSYQDQNGTSQNAQNSENDSDSNSADSDYGPLNERSTVKKKSGKQLPQRSAKKANVNYANSSLNGSAVKSSQLNGSFKQGAKLTTYDPSTDLKLVESVAQKLVYFLLIEDQKKYAIRRKGIVTHVFKDDYHPKLYTAVIKKANVILKKIYGMELMELENQKDSYLIVNILKRELGIHDYVDLPRIKQQQHGLIMFLLTVIYMNENIITEDELTRCLKPLGIDLTSKRMHPVFGDVKKYITTELVKQMYLNYECISKEPPKYEFSWGLRAKQEFDKRDLLQFVCTIMDDTAPEDWRIQHRDAEASAKPNTKS